jgi:CheY-like chemotaxis protein
MYPDYKILIVEDNKETIELLRIIISRKFGCIIYQALDGESALQLIQEKGIPDLILLDLMMPVMNGQIFLQHIRENRNTKNIPVIIISVMDKKNSIFEIPDQDLRNYIVKPIIPKIVIEKVELNINKRYNELMQIEVDSDGLGYFFYQPYPKDIDVKLTLITGIRYDQNFLLKVGDSEFQELQISENPTIRFPKHNKPLKLTFKFKETKNEFVNVFFKIISSDSLK